MEERVIELVGAVLLALVGREGLSALIKSRTAAVHQDRVDDLAQLRAVVEEQSRYMKRQDARIKALENKLAERECYWQQRYNELEQRYTDLERDAAELGEMYRAALTQKNEAAGV